MVDLLHAARFKLERSYHVAFAFVGASVGSPGALFLHLFVCAARAGFGEHDFLHHLAHDAVGENHRGSAIFESQVKAEANEIHHFLHCGRCEHDEVVVAVAAAFSGLEIVGLRRLDCAEARPPRITLSTRAGSMAPARYDMPSCLRLTPGDEEDVITAFPEAAPP